MYRRHDSALFDTTTSDLLRVKCYALHLRTCAGPVVRDSSATHATNTPHGPRQDLHIAGKAVPIKFARALLHGRQQTTYSGTAPDIREHTIAQLTDMNMNEFYSQATHNGEP